MSKQMIGWDSLTLEGRNAQRRWYRTFRRHGGSRWLGRLLVAERVWGAIYGPAGDWVKGVEVHHGS